MRIFFRKTKDARIENYWRSHEIQCFVRNHDIYVVKLDLLLEFSLVLDGIPENERQLLYCLILDLDGVVEPVLQPIIELHSSQSQLLQGLQRDVLKHLKPVPEKLFLQLYCLFHLQLLGSQLSRLFLLLLTTLLYVGFFIIFLGLLSTLYFMIKKIKFINSFIV